VALLFADFAFFAEFLNDTGGSSVSCQLYGRFSSLEMKGKKKKKSTPRARYKEQGTKKENTEETSFVLAPLSSSNLTISGWLL